MSAGAEQRVVVIGGGPAAKAAVGAYREVGGRGPVTVLAAEDALPYERPPLSKDFLRGETDRGALTLQSAAWYAEREVEVVRAAEVAELDLGRGLASSADGRHWRFDRCLLATGSRPFVPEIPGTEIPGVRTIRTIADSTELARYVGAEVIVVGSGFIGCEAAASLALRGADVSLATIEAAPQLDRLGEEVSERLRAWLSVLGVGFVGEAELIRISGSESRLTVELGDGHAHRAQGVLLALGVTRNDELAAAAGVETDGGVPVDAAMVSSDPRLLAAGDVALAENATAGRRLAVEHWGEALKHGEIAGRTLAGEEASWGAAPGFWSTIGRETVKWAGWGDGWDEVRFEGHEEQGFSAWYGREGELVGVLTHEHDLDYEKGQTAIEERAPWS